MKLAVFADVHGNLTALETVLQHIDRENVDKTWVLGDLAAHGGSPAECVTLIRERHQADEKNFQVIGGNTDRYLVTNARSARPPAADADAYQQLATEFEQENDMLSWATARLGWENYEFLSQIIGKEVRHKADGYGYIFGYHAVPGDDEHSIEPDTPDEEALDSVLDRPLRMGVYAHIHHQVDRDLGRVHLVNPGSVGLSFQHPGQVQYAILTLSDGTVSVDLRETDYDTDAAARALHANGHPHPAAVETFYTGA